MSHHITGSSERYQDERSSTFQLAIFGLTTKGPPRFTNESHQSAIFQYARGNSDAISAKYRPPDFSSSANPPPCRRMPAKRSLSPTSSDSTSPPKKEKNAKSGKTDSPGKTASTWTAESKAVLIEQLLTVGFAQASMSDLAAQVGLAELGVELNVGAG